MCFFIDAIDEIESDAKSRDGMIQFMKDLVSDDVQGRGRFKLCLASRPENEIAIHFQDVRGLRVQDLTGNDISNFVHDRLDAHPSARATRRSDSYDETLQHICQEIIGAAQGVFLWVRVVVDHVLSSQTRGESLSEIRRTIHDLPNEDLSQYFIRILQKTPRETRKLTNALFQTLLASHEPLCILTVGVLLDIVSERQAPQKRHSFTEERLSELSSASLAIGRRLSDLTGGLIQVISDDRDDRDDRYNAEDTDDTDITRLPASRGREGSGSRNQVRFLHQSVQDFFQAPASDSTLERDDLLSADTADPMCDGHMLNLFIVDAYLGLTADERRSSGWVLNATKVTMQNSPATESSFADSSFEILSRISEDLSMHHDCTWGIDAPAWKPTFLAFAVSHKMHTFVQKCLEEGGLQEPKKGRPLLHYAAWAPGCYPDAAMAEILLKAGASLHQTFKESSHHRAKTALESLSFEEVEQDGQSHVDFIKFCMDRGAKVTRPIPCGDGPWLTSWMHNAPAMPRHIRRVLNPLPWTTVLHAVAEGPLKGVRKMEILQNLPRSQLNHKRADGFTVFGLLLKSGTSESNCIKSKDAEKLIQRGALITRRVVDMGSPTSELVKRHSRYKYYRHGAWRRRKTLIKDGRLVV